MMLDLVNKCEVSGEMNNHIQNVKIMKSPGVVMESVMHEMVRNVIKRMVLVLEKCVIALVILLILRQLQSVMHSECYLLMHENYQFQ